MNCKRIIIVGILTIALLTNIAIAPSTHAIVAQLTAKEQLRNTIEDGFGSYLDGKNLRIDNATIQKNFFPFINTNPIYKEQFQKLINISKAESEARLPKTIPDISKAVIQAPFKIENRTINGTSYEVSYSHAFADGQDIIKICSGQGDDPLAYISIDTLYTNIFGFNIEVGEQQHLILNFPAGADATAFLPWFDIQVTHSTNLNNVVWTVTGGLSGITVFGPIISAIEWMFSNNNLQDYKTMVDDSYNANHGYTIRMDNTVIYPFALTTLLPDFAIYAKYYYNGGGPGDDGVWEKAFPLDTSYLYYVLQDPLGAESNAFLLGYLIHDRLIPQIPLNTWGWITLPGFIDPDPQSGPTPLKQVTIDSYDATVSTTVSGANVIIDGYSVGTTGSTYTLTPETHSFMTSPTWHLYENGYQFFNYNGYEYDIEQTIEITSDITITANYVETQWFSASAFEPSTGTVWTDIYIDGNYAGNGVINLEIPKGSHSVSVAYQTVHWGELVTCDYYSDTVYLGNSPVDKSFEYHFGQ